MSTNKKRVLIVEDEDNIALALSLIIERQGYALERVANGSAAIAALEANRPDLVVLDAMIPEVSGYGVCQYIRESADLGDMKVLMISASGEGARRKALDIGADAFFLKPFDTKALTGKIGSLLGEAPVV
ncbi:MAG: response regulator [Pseudomonadota bacterium]